ncbi:MAG: HGGxSTG domain-containing protein [Rhodoferax sp.]
MSNSRAFTTAGGRINCAQCQAQSKRTKQQCRAPASKGMTKCRFHGGVSTGPKTTDGRARCAAAKTVHGFETRKTRTERAEGMRRLRNLEELGHLLDIISGPRTRGRKPT